jgi:hypothetical protein
MATAMPRRRMNQCEMSAMSGPKKVAAAEAEQKVRGGEERDRAGAAEARSPPISRARRRPARAGDPQRSTHPSHDEVAQGEADHAERVGKRRAARVVPNSASIAGITTMTAHMPTLPTMAMRQRYAKPAPGISAVVDLHGATLGPAAGSVERDFPVRARDSHFGTRLRDEETIGR